MCASSRHAQGPQAPSRRPGAQRPALRLLRSILEAMVAQLHAIVIVLYS